MTRKALNAIRVYFEYGGYRCYYSGRFFSDVILHNVEFEKVEVGKGEPIEAGDYTVKTETTYDLIMQESEADLYIKTEKEQIKCLRQLMYINMFLSRELTE